MLEITHILPQLPKSAPHEQRLLGRLEAARRRAVELEKPVLLRLHVTLPAVDPWAVWRAQAPAGEPFFLWNDGRMGLSTAAWGDLVRHTLSHARRFDEARSHCSRLLEQVFDVSWDA